MDNKTNGVGPDWFPIKIREWLTKFSLIFFDESCWINHDIRYTKGGNLHNKFYADACFFKGLLYSLKNKNLFKIILGSMLSVLYFTSVLFFGVFSFNFKNKE